LTSVALVAFLVAGLWFFLHTLVRSRMHTLEVDGVHDAAETARNLVLVAEEGQLASARDWGMWGATWDFMRAAAEGRDDAAYREENLNATSLGNAGAPLIVYLDMDGAIVEALVVKDEEVMAAPEEIRSADWGGLAATVEIDGRCGLVRIGEGVLIVGASAITQSMGQGERAGTLVMGRWLDDEEAKAISHALGKTVTFRLASATDRDGAVVPLDDARIVGEFVLRDFAGNPAVVGEVMCEREILAHARSVNRVLLVGLILFGAITAGAVYALIHVLVVSRLVRASREVLHVAGCDAGSALIRVDRDDELGRLVDSVNQLTTKLNRSREKIEEALHEQTIVSDANRKLAMVAARTDNAVIITDAKGTIEWVNLAFMRLTGYTPDQAIGRRPGELLQGPLTDQESIVKVREAVREGRHVDTEMLNYRQDGSSYWVRMSIEPVRDDDGAIQHYIAIESDVSQQKAFERALIEARAAAEDAASARAVFVANVSHEIRTPLNAILGFTELLRRGTSEGSAGDQSGLAERERDEWLGIVHSSATHLLDLINDVLDLSKLQAGRMTVEQLPTTVRELIQQSANMHAVRATQKSVALEIDIEESMPMRLDLDPMRLRQLLANVVGNAVKFTDAGSVRVEAVWVEANEDPSAGVLLVTVRDTGIGIPESKMRELFTPFVQGDTSVTRRFGGTGLGLAICKGIAEAMGGTIEVDSEVGNGTTVRLEIPAPRSIGDDDAAPTMGVEESDSTKSMPRCLAGARLLIADDMPANLRLFEIVLREAGAVVVTVNDGQQAVAATLRQPFDLILLDGQMPVMDGLTAASIMRSRGIAAPILALTAHAMESEVNKFIDAGCDAHLSKPISPMKLVRAVAEHLGREGTQGAIDEDDLANDPEVRAIIDEFVASVSARLSKVLDALAAGDFADAARQAHALKGTAGTLGVHAVARVAAAIERAAEREDVDAAVEAMQVYDMLNSDEGREGREAA
jgi:PAS domain S-box-containing protein